MLKNINITASKFEGLRLLIKSHGFAKVFKMDPVHLEKTPSRGKNTQAHLCFLSSTRQAVESPRAGLSLCQKLSNCRSGGGGAVYVEVMKRA